MKERKAEEEKSSTHGKNQTHDLKNVGPRSECFTTVPQTLSKVASWLKLIETKPEAEKFLTVNRL